MFNIYYSNYILSYNLSSDEIIDNYENYTTNGSNYEWGSTQPSQATSNPDVANANTLSGEVKTTPLSSLDSFLLFIVFIAIIFFILLYLGLLWHKKDVDNQLNIINKY